jgi:hypothetical protein
VKKLNVLIVALSVTLLLPMASQSEEKSAPPAEQSTPAEKSAEAPAKCLKAAVNPVTGRRAALLSIRRNAPRYSVRANRARTIAATPSPCMSIGLDATSRAAIRLMVRYDASRLVRRRRCERSL